MLKYITDVYFFKVFLYFWKQIQVCIHLNEEVEWYNNSIPEWINVFEQIGWMNDSMTRS